MSFDTLSDREIRVLEAVIQVYIETAEPAGSQTIAQRFPLGALPSAHLRRPDSHRPGLPLVRQ
jgi:transcriptional regulator of heat shock response